jgi:hypothetical protein
MKSISPGRRINLSEEYLGILSAEFEIDWIKLRKIPMRDMRMSRSCKIVQDIACEWEIGV